MAAAKRPSRPRSGGKISKLIEVLPFLSEIDQKLLKGEPASVVATFIQEDKGELTSVSHETLAKELSVRRRKKQGAGDWWGMSPESVDDEDEDLATLVNYRRKPVTPRKASRTIAERREDAIVDMIELEALYLAQRDRCDRLMELESLVGAFGEITTKAIDSASEILWKRIQARSKMNEGEQSGLDINLSIKNYSRETMEVLSNPESRHRIMSLLERVTRFGKSKVPLPDESIDALPLPKPSSASEE